MRGSNISSSELAHYTNGILIATVGGYAMALQLLGPPRGHSR